MGSLWPGSVPTKEGQRSGQRRGVAGVFGLGSLRWTGGREEVKDRSPTIEGQPAPKIPKIPIALDDTGESKQLP